MTQPKSAEIEAKDAYRAAVAREVAARSANDIESTPATREAFAVACAEVTALYRAYIALRNERYATLRTKAAQRRQAKTAALADTPVDYSDDYTF